MKYLLAALLVVAVASIGLYIRDNKINSSEVKQEVTNSDSKQSESVAPTGATKTAPTTMQKQLKKPDLAIDKSAAYTATLTTSAGDIVIGLDTQNTPITANNFVYLAENKFYDNSIFHRIINGFMIQGGDPTGTGSGGPGYRFDDEPVVGEYERGTVAMANAGPNTNGSQFFIMHEAKPLQKLYVIFGKVTQGMDVVDKIATMSVTLNAMGNEESKPVNPVSIVSVKISKE